MGKYFQSLGVTPPVQDTVDVPFGEWLPDLMPMNNPGATEALNVVPKELGYAPFYDLESVGGDALPEACIGAISIVSEAGSVRVYAGTVTGLFVRSGSTFDRKYTTGFDLSNKFLWQFFLFGDNLVAIHADLAKPLFVAVLSDDDFVDVGGGPPQARCGSRVGDFVVLGNTVDDDGAKPSRIRWGGFNRLDAPWVTDPDQQSDFNDMPTEGGQVMAVAGHEDGTIFQESLISRMAYVGLPTVFKIDTVEQNRGALCTGGVVDFGSTIYFISEDGFFSWNGVNSTPIGTNRINRYFFRRLNYDARGRIVGSVDTINECVHWAFPVGDSSALTEIITYSYSQNRWAHTMLEIEYIFPATTPGINLDELLGNLDTDYPISFDDDEAFQHSGKKLGGFTTAHVLGTFTGGALEAVLETSEASGPKFERLFVNSARPSVDLAEPNATMAVGKRDQMEGEALAWGDPVTQEITGECSILEDARFMRFRVTIPAGETWLHAIGAAITRQLAGKR